MQFFAGSTLLGSAILSQGVATFTDSTLAVNQSYSIDAVYNGSASVTNSTSSARTSLAVNPAATTVSLNCSPSSTDFDFVYGTTLTLTAQVKPPRVPPRCPQARSRSTTKMESLSARPR